ncbi:MAG: riboflavin biosynthesis protein RibF [Meiothermus sp.]|uniref:riboflavin biosynthesis protein RibF n=1 Tax=Meiothermus sp. TaxID=1955249 RepID=UPI0025F968AA|nr:riboflavin biosynthesis protein RibF [Meiothermus sp.]MCS7057605.1 riboflavin biosynthesis protein RibF [Meiothermus sp.]MCS7193957.1 riboflavin biosynthesis protein RibF [Meiothermus sp.]MCX7740383.1 riboflavin biosynthesis protein RibF [Meiothermus sp.]MDW8090757.1 riboflavin biosynthesis protein RibF [Meiothermus sp.]MDW8480819.1 riboflavin biosynthesis protein RibF [Meiothermus sp.]
MLLINDPQDAPTGPKVVAIGSFDGLHLGHQHLIHQARNEAHQRHIPLLLYTFDPPSKVFTRGEGFLTDLSEKVELLRGLGVEIALVVPFTEAFAQRSKEEFLQELRRLEAACFYVGADFRFGQGRKGGLEDLQSVAPARTLPLLELLGGPVKSSRIRELLRAGAVEEAQRLLGRPYSARGIVQEGDKLGRRLGFPTANVGVAPLKILPPGVFAVRVQTPQGRYGGMANVGHRPTVLGQHLRLEVHLFGFAGDLYGQEVSVEFLARLREERKFESLEALKAQLAQDAEAARRQLGI